MDEYCSYSTAVSPIGWRCCEMMVKRLIPRLWFYLRIGFSTYLSFMLAVANFIILAYNLALSRLAWWGLGMMETTVIILVFLIPSAVFMGWMHMNKLGTYQADTGVAMAANQFCFEAVPGKEREVIMPYSAFQARLNENMMLAFNELLRREVFSAAEIGEARRWNTMFKRLADGGNVNES